MSSSFGPEALRTATFRLAVRHAALFALLSLVTFALVYLALHGNLTRRVEAELSEDLDEMASKLHAAPATEQANVFRADLDAPDSDREFRVFLPRNAGEPVTSNLRGWRDVDVLPQEVRSLPPGGEEWRTAAAPYLKTHVRILARRDGDGDLLVFGASLADNEDLLGVVHRTFLFGWLATLLPGLMLGWFMARRALAGVDRVTATAVQIGRSDLTRRVPIGNDGLEIEALARAFNEMLDRIHGSVRELKDVTSYVAHDLKGPIARIRGQVESAATAGTIDGATAANLVDECDRLATMIDTVLELAANDARIAALAPAAVDLARIARDAVELYRPAAEDRGIELSHSIDESERLVRGDVGRARRVLSNLLDNAIKYTPAGGSIRVSARSTPGRVWLSIADTGVGIEPEALTRVFDRFFRGDASRSTAGHGLGLTLARALVRAYDGEISVRSTPGAGSEFTIEWPSWDGPPDQMIIPRSSSG